MKKLTLVQRVAELEEFIRMRDSGYLPLVVGLTDDEVRLLKANPDTSPLGINSLYYPAYQRNKNNLLCMFLGSDYLRELIESRRACVLEFIDLNGETKYVDYVKKSYSVDCEGVIVFRDRKRLWGSSQAKYSLNKNQRKGSLVSISIGNVSGSVPMFYSESMNEDSEQEELLILCADTLSSYTNGKEKQLIK